MKQKDHKALAYYLMDYAGEGLLWKKTWHRRFFLLGCVSPDYIPFTYLRGFRQSHAMRGHNACYSGEHIRKRIHTLQNRGINGFRDCFALGTLIHYLADSFTYPHTKGFCGTMREHRRYENILHETFLKYLSHAKLKEPSHIALPSLLSERLQKSRREYDRLGGSYELDCKQILTSCTDIFQVLCAK